jgi:hypothetical protein
VSEKCCELVRREGDFFSFRFYKGIEHFYSLIILKQKTKNKKQKKNKRFLYVHGGGEVAVESRD